MNVANGFRYANAHIQIYISTLLNVTHKPFGVFRDQKRSEIWQL